MAAFAHMSMRMLLIAAVLATLVLPIVSLFIGVSDLSPMALLFADPDDRTAQILLISRIPRTLALILSGIAMAIAGMIMQMLARNRFVEPSTIGTMESASLGLLAITLFWPGAPLLAKMGVASLFALAGTALFLRILALVKWRDVLIVPLVGLMLAGAIGAFTEFFAYRFELMQSLYAWRIGDFSGVLRGRYELLWLSLAMTLIAYIAADRFTVAGLGEAFTTNLGLGYKRVMALGLTIVALITAINVVTVGMVPFLGLIVPNIVSLSMGDNMRRGLPFVAVLGAGLVLACDIIGRVIRFPYEIPIATIMGVIGAILFLYLLLRRERAGA